MYGEHLEYPPIKDRGDYKLISVIQGSLENGDHLRKGSVLYAPHSDKSILVKPHLLARALSARVLESQRIGAPDRYASATYNKQINELEERRLYFACDEYKSACIKFKKQNGVDILNHRLDLDILIDTTGGSGEEAYIHILLAQAVRLLGGRVRAFVTNQCISAGAHIFMNAAQRYVLPSTYFMTHPPTEYWQDVKTSGKLYSVTNDSSGTIYGMRRFIELNGNENKGDALDICNEAEKVWDSCDSDDQEIRFNFSGNQLAHYGLAACPPCRVEMKQIFDSSHAEDVRKHPLITSFFEDPTEEGSP